MTEIVPISSSNIGGEEINTVDARKLHEALGVAKDFTDWVKAQIERARLAVNRDYVFFPQKGENSGRGRSSTEYHLTIDAAKHIAMMSGTEKGFKVRDYFIECERRAKDPMTALNDPAAMRGLLLTYTEKVLALEAEKAELEPKADAMDRLSTADGMVCVTDAAKLMQVRPQDLFAYLREHKWIYRRAGCQGNIAYQTRIQQGVLTHKVVTVEQADGSSKTLENLKVTPKGLTALAKAFGRPDPVMAKRQGTLLN